MFHKKQIRTLITIFICCITLNSYCQYYTAQVFYNSGEKTDTEIKLPIKKEDKIIQTKIQGALQDIPAENIKYVVIKLNNDSDEYVIKRGLEIKFNSSGTMEFRNKRQQWTMIEKVYDHMVISQYAAAYDVKKAEGKDIMLTYFSNTDSGYYISRYDDDKLFHLKKINPRFIEKNIKPGQGYLFDKCPEYIENLDIEEFITDNPFFELVQRYEQCILIQQEKN